MACIEGAGWRSSPSAAPVGKLENVRIVMPNPSTLVGTTTTELRPLSGSSDPLLGSAAQLRRVIQRRLGDATADLLAEPQLHENGAAIDWYAGWSGEVRRISDLAPVRRTQLLAQVHHALGEIVHLGKKLATSSGASDANLVGRLLQLAVHYPSDDFVFLVGDRPVIICWGYGADAVGVLPAISPALRTQEISSPAVQSAVTPTTATAPTGRISAQGSTNVARRRPKARLSFVSLIAFMLLMPPTWLLWNHLAAPLSHMIGTRKEITSSVSSEAHLAIPPETQCDNEAAHPLDPSRLGAGLTFEKIDASKAIASCIDALAHYPGSARLQYQLGRAYLKNNEIDLAAKWYRLAADQGYGQAQFNLGNLYQNGQGVPLDYAAAMSWYRKAADQGLAVAQFANGAMYAEGQGVQQDYAVAASWYRKAADQGYDRAQFGLGTLYASGQGVSLDYAAAVSWYRKAADQGLTVAQHNLASAYYNGRGVPQNYVTAADWYRKAAELGLPDSQFSLGNMYADGEGLPQSFATAIEWLRKAAEQGDFKAQNRLGSMYADGRGVPQDYGVAASWYEKSAEQGNAAAQANLGGLYFNGQGVPRDYVQAYKWLNLAVSRSELSEKARFEVVIHARDEALKRMTPSQIAEAQKLAREWRPQEKH